MSGGRKATVVEATDSDRVDEMFELFADLIEWALSDGEALADVAAGALLAVAAFVDDDEETLH